MNLEDELNQILDELFEYSGATFCYTSASVGVTGSCYKSYTQSTRYETDQFGYNKSYQDFSVMVKREDVAGWNPEPLKEKVYVDYTPYLVGGIVTSNAAYHWISLRNYNNQ